MLKKFLKLFKHDEQQGVPDFEGSYLDYVLSYVEEGVRHELERCAEHDPLLLVITQTLRASMPGVWSEAIERPLLDQHSPVGPPTPPSAPPNRTPPPPPGASAAPKPPPATKDLNDTQEFDVSDIEFLAEPPPKKELVETDEFDRAELERAADEMASEEDEVELTGEEETAEALREEPPAEEAGDAEEVESLEEAATLDVEREDVVESDEAVIEEVEEELEEDSELIEDVTPAIPSPLPTFDPTGEFHVKDATAKDDSKLPRLDQREVLQAGRVFLGMLIENDRLPTELQLGLEELMLARDLLMGQHIGATNLDQKAQQLLRIVERKFSEGQFSQARLLLQLFQTDRQTRVRNDRNIFYEDMIQRLGIRRRHPVASDLIDEFKRFSPGKPNALVEMSRWLDSKIFIKLHLFSRRNSEVTRWRELANKSSLSGGADNLLRYLPPKRWRPFFVPADAAPPTGAVLPELPLEDLILQHIHPDTLSNYVMSHMRTCYFVLRAVGDTGLEGYLDTFFDWTRNAFDFNATVFLPELYRRSMGEADMMRPIFTDLYDRYMREPAERWLASLSEEQIRQAAAQVAKTIHACNLNDVPPGNYDLGGFVYDELFKMSYPTREFAFKLHRLT